VADIGRWNTFCRRECERPIRPSWAVISFRCQFLQQERPEAAIGLLRNSLGRANSRSASLAACSGVRPRLR
jgi:hypothetical protein